MVYAFVIQTLVPGPCRLLYSAIYANETQQSVSVSRMFINCEINCAYLIVNVICI